jgi:hypothetical protein
MNDYASLSKQPPRAQSLVGLERPLALAVPHSSICRCSWQSWILDFLLSW